MRTWPQTCGMGDMTEIKVERLGYRHPKYLTAIDRWAGLLKMNYTTGLFVGITEWEYERRFCYEDWHEARKALEAWDGAGDPPGSWIKEKPSNRLGPGAERQ